MEGIQIRTGNNGKKSYRVHINKKVNGKKKFISKTFSSLTKAKLWRQQTICSIEDKSYFKYSEATKHSLADTIIRYEREVLPNKPHTKQEQQFRWWKKHIGSCLLSDVTPALIVEYRNKLIQTLTRFGKAMKPATVNRYLAALSHLFTIAMKEWEWVSENPVLKVSKIKIGPLRIRILDDLERERLLATCKESNHPYLYPVVVLALSTGMRKSEIFNLTPKNIDLLNGRIILERTKNGERRVVPLKGHAYTIIEQLLQNKQQHIKYLFPSEKKSQPIDLRCHWEKALKLANIHDFHFHDLRHTAASLFLMSGATLAELAEILGHKTLAMVKRYAHLTEVHAADVVLKMNEKYIG